MTGLIVLMLIALASLVAILTALLVREMTHPPRHTAGYAIARGLAVDPGDPGLKFEEWWLDRPDRARLPVWEVEGKRSEVRGQRSAVGERSLTVVFVYGWGHSRIDMLARAQWWAPLCDRLVFYDLRGHGEATGTSRLGDGEERDLLALLDRLNDGPAILVGHSMGAVIAIAAAAVPPPSQEGGAGGRIAGVVAYGPYADFHASLRGRWGAAGFPTRPITDLALAWLRLRGLRPAEVTLETASGLRGPLLLVHGSDDRVPPIEDARRIVDAAADAALVEIRGAGHLDAHLVDPARHDDAVMAFVERVASEEAATSKPRTEVPGF